MKTSFDKGREEGRKEGREEGEHKKALDTARKMKSDGIPLESIARYTGLTVEEIASISG
jgi:predicted transposase/invertase (TIGR01784 family)